MANGEATMFLTVLATGDTLNLSVILDTNSCFIQTKALDLGKVHFTKFIDQIVTHISNRTFQDEMFVKVFGSDDEDGPFTLDATIPLSAVDPGNIAPPGRKYFKIRFQDDFIKERWHLDGFVIFGELGGEEF